MLFINTTHPYLKVLVPETGEWAEFRGGKLELDEDDPAFAAVMAEAQRNPLIRVVADGVQCPDCGEPFVGKAAKPQLGRHRKEVHFERWLADREAENAEAIAREVKRNQPLACDLCPRLQEFANAEELALHVQAIHTNPNVDDDGNALGSGSGNAAEADPAEPPAAIVR